MTKSTVCRKKYNGENVAQLQTSKSMKKIIQGNTKMKKKKRIQEPKSYLMAPSVF